MGIQSILILIISINVDNLLWLSFPILHSYYCQFWFMPIAIPIW